MFNSTRYALDVVQTLDDAVYSSMLAPATLTNTARRVAPERNLLGKEGSSPILARPMR